MFGSALYGYNLISTIDMVDKVRVRRHRKKRIDKKWLKRYGYRYIPKKDVLIAGNNIYGHPVTLRKLQAEMRKKGY